MSDVQNKTSSRIVLKSGIAATIAGSLGLALMIDDGPTVIDADHDYLAAINSKWILPSH